MTETIIWTETTYTTTDGDRVAIRVTWADLKSAGLRGDGSDDHKISQALRRAGAPGWVFAADGAVDSDGYYLLGDEVDTTGTTEILTDDMIRKLRDEAGAAGDTDQVRACNDALSDHSLAGLSRSACAKAINAARSMDSKPFVRVVA